MNFVYDYVLNEAKKYGYDAYTCEVCSMDGLGFYFTNEYVQFAKKYAYDLGDAWREISRDKHDFRIGGYADSIIDKMGIDEALDLVERVNELSYSRYEHLKDYCPRIIELVTHLENMIVWACEYAYSTNMSMLAQDISDGEMVVNEEGCVA